MDNNLKNIFTANISGHGNSATLTIRKQLPNTDLDEIMEVDGYITCRFNGHDDDIIDELGYESDYDLCNLFSMMDIISEGAGHLVDTSRETGIRFRNKNRYRDYDIDYDKEPRYFLEVCDDKDSYELNIDGSEAMLG